MRLQFDYSIAQIGLDKIDLLKSKVANALKAIIDAFNNNITYADNIKCNIVKNVQFVNGVENGISHTLGVIPLGFLVVSKDSVADIRSGPSAWSTNRINLIANANVFADIIILGG